MAEQQPAPCRPPRNAALIAYEPRRPENTVLHQVVRENLETFLARARAQDRPVPRFVERELRAYLECGILAHGLVRVHCDECGHDRVVAFSCKGRGFCPSCGGRRMADTAAHLVDRVLPVVPVRQWVLSLPHALRYRLAYDRRLTTEVLRIFVRCVFASLRRRARQRRHGLLWPQCGAVTFLQRFGDALNTNIHFHTLVLDGVYEGHRSRPLRFHELPPPDTEEVRRVARRFVRQLARLLERHGHGDAADPSATEIFSEDEPLLAALYSASVRGRVATGRRAGQRVLRFGDRIDSEDLEQAPKEHCASVDGVSLHAGVDVPARDRRRLERLCRYVARPPLATERLSRLADGRLLYRLKHRWRDGTTHVLFEPLELIEKLAALVPPPRSHQVRYHGILAPCAGNRSRVTPGAPAPGPAPAPRRASGGETTSRGAPEPSGVPSRNGTRRKRRLSWAELMQRVFAVDVLECARCKGRMRILAAVHAPDAVRAILECLGLPSRAPPNAPARTVEEAPLLPGLALASSDSF